MSIALKASLESSNAPQSCILWLKNCHSTDSADYASIDAQHCCSLKYEIKIEKLS